MEDFVVSKDLAEKLKEQKRYKAYYQANREQILERTKARQLANRPAHLAAKRKYYKKIRAEVINHYGGVCVCCGIAEIAFLALDHKDGGGAEHRREVGTTAMTHWVRKNGYPPIFQVLCHNCNMAKHIHGGCPHQEVTNG